MQVFQRTKVLINHYPFADKLNPKERVKYFKINNYDDFELIQSHEITEHEANSILTNVKIKNL